jgi:glutamate-1-semialdehyde 2,1-aminomutase
LMDNVLPAGKVYQAGTLSGNPLATAAGAKTLEILRDENPYPYLEEQARRLASGLSEAATSNGIANQVQRMGSMLTLFFNDQPIVDWPTANRSNRKLFAQYFWGLIDEGVYMPCSQFEALFFSREHRPEDIDYTVEAAKRVLSKVG